MPATSLNGTSQPAEIAKELRPLMAFLAKQDRVVVLPRKLVPPDLLATQEKYYGPGSYIAIPETWFYSRGGRPEIVVFYGSKSNPDKFNECLGKTPLELRNEWEIS
jgi:hypothetical protein